MALSKEEELKRSEALAFYNNNIVPKFQERMDKCGSEFIEFIRSKVSSTRAELIISALQSKSFFSDPAGVAYHSACPGGLCEHTYKVALAALKFRAVAVDDYEKGLITGGLIPPTEEETVVAAVLHDTCKIGTYAVDIRFTKIGHSWARYPGYIKADPLPLGHGEKSIIWCLCKQIKLSFNEMLGIRWHMGRYEAGSETSMELKSFYEASKLSMLPQILHDADNYASHFMEESFDLSKYAVLC